MLFVNDIQSGCSKIIQSNSTSLELDSGSIVDGIHFHLVLSRYRHLVDYHSVTPSGGLAYYQQVSPLSFSSVPWSIRPLTTHDVFIFKVRFLAASHMVRGDVSPVSPPDGQSPGLGQIQQKLTHLCHMWDILLFPRKYRHTGINKKDKCKNWKMN